MGISGLTTFLKNFFLDDVLEEIELSDCTLLIDGYSLLYQINASSNLQSIHGGNYDDLHTKLTDIFSKLKTCHIRPIVLLDGGRDVNERKFRTSLKRAGDRLREVNCLNNLNQTPSGKNSATKTTKMKLNLETLISSGNYRILTNLLPIVSYRIYLDILEKFNIDHYQCFFEADYDLACLANELKCPLLSCDSDFFIYDLKYGYISIHNLDFDIRQRASSSQYYLPAKVYKLDKFVDILNSNLDNQNPEIRLRKEMMAIFAALCGNDYVDKSLFSSFLTTLDSSNNNRSLRFNRQRRNTHFHRILDWLTQFESVQSCLDSLLNCVKKENREQVRRLLTDSVDDYMCQRQEARTQLFLNAIQTTHSIDEVTTSFEQVSTFGGTVLSRDFLGEFFHSKLARISLDVLIHRKVVFNCQIELFNWPSSYLSSMQIRRHFYKLLVEKYETSSQKPVLIREYLRYRGDLKIYELDLDQVESVSSWSFPFVQSQLLHLTNEQCELYRKFSWADQRLRNLLCLVYFWTQTNYDDEPELKNVKSTNFVRAFFVSLIKLSLIDPCYEAIKAERSSLPAQKSAETVGTSINSVEGDWTGTANRLDFDYWRKKIVDDAINDDYVKEMRIKLGQYCPSFNFYQNVFKNSTANKLEKYLNLKTVHVLCEFQSIYLSWNYLVDAVEHLKLLTTTDQSFRALDLRCFFNSSFLHNFIEDLQRRSNPDLFVEDFFGRRSLFTHIYRELVSLYSGLFSVNFNPITLPNTSTQHKKNKR